MSGWASGKTGTGGGGGLAPSAFDDVKIIRDADGDPILYEFFLSSVLVGSIEVFYDFDKNANEYKAV